MSSLSVNLLNNCNIPGWEGLIWTISKNQWPFQDPKLEVPTIYKAYVREYPHKIWPYMVQYLQFRILEFPLTKAACVKNLEHGELPKGSLQQFLCYA